MISNITMSLSHSSIWLLRNKILFADTCAFFYRFVAQIKFTSMMKENILL